MTLVLYRLKASTRLPSANLTIKFTFETLTNKTQQRKYLDAQCKPISEPAVEGEPANVVENVYNHHEAAAEPGRVEQAHDVALDVGRPYFALCYIYWERIIHFVYYNLHS